MTVNHIGGFKICNYASKLEYLTSLDNTKHAVALGISNRGSRHGLSKLNESQVKEIRDSKASWPHARLAEEYGCSPSTIGRVLARQMWKHI